MASMSREQREALFGPMEVPEAAVLPEQDEIERYRNQPRILPTASPLAYWRDRRDPALFPILGRLARRYLAIQSSSAAVERVFSVSGNLVTKRRASLAKDTVEDLVLCHDNIDML